MSLSDNCYKGAGIGNEKGRREDVKDDIFWEILTGIFSLIALAIGVCAIQGIVCFLS